MKKILETFILAAIFLVLIYTFVDEYSRYAHWSVMSRNMLLVTGFCFDLIFSIEFTVRSIYGAKRGGFIRYIKYERGWVDFLSSFPLLLLDTGPSLYMLLLADAHSGIGAMAAMNVLKIVKAIRITRILRLVRIIKIFGKIHNAESEMAQHHTAVITTTAVFTIISVLLAFNLVFGTSASHFSKDRMSEYVNLISEVKRIADITGAGFRESSEGLFLSDKKILKIIYSSGTVIEKIPGTEFVKYYDEEDYISVTGKGCTLLVSTTDINREIALEHMQNFFVIIFIVLSFMVVYTRHFVQNISDPVHILNLGFRKRDYNFLVKIPEQNAGHEVFKLAGFYNDAYLPSKMKKIYSDSAGGDKPLSMSDIAGFK